ncbi:MAG: hypothetical protein HGA19_24700 [Oscillochloris sp.]|nr:hypothetical protein [Oscillochloris sp.]
MLHLVFFLLHACVLLLVVLSAAFGYGALILSLLRLPQTVRREVIVFALGIGLGTLSFLVLCVGALGLIYPAVIGSILALGVAMAVVIGRKLWRQPLVALHVPPVARTVSQQAAWLGLVLIIALALVFSLCAHALMPPVDNDVVAYHFAIPKLYIQAHGLIYLPYILHSNWPLGSEMLSLIGLIFHSEVLALLINWAFVVLLCVALVTFGERWLPFRTGWITAAVLCSVPMLTRLAGTGMVEVPLTCYTFLAFYALWHWHESGAGNWLVLSALLAGCAAATKLNAAATAIIFALVALVLVLISGQIARAVRVFALYGLLSFLVVLPWYIKAWVFTGNPIWPFLYPLLGGRNWDGLGSTYLMDYLSLTNMEPTFGNWLTGLWQVTAANGRFGSFLLGPYTLVLLPLLVYAVAPQRTDKPLRAAQGWLERYNRPIVIGASLIFGLWFLVKGVTGLIG